MAQQDAWLDVRHVLGALFVHGRKVGAGILKPLSVPSEDTALSVHTGIAGGEVKAVDGEALVLDGVDEIEHRVVAVLFQLRIVHAGALIAQCTLRQQGGTACEQRVVVHNPAQGIATQQEQVDISPIGLPVGIARPIVGLFLAHVEHRLVEVVIKQTNRFLRCTAEPDVEGDVLVERVHEFRVIAHGVGGALAQKSLVLVEGSGLFAEAVEAVLLFHAAVGGNALIGVERKGTSGKGGVKLRALCVVQADTDGIPIQFQTQRGAFKKDGFLPFRDLWFHGLYPHALTLKERVETVFPRGRHEDIGFLCELPIKGDPHPHDFIRDKYNLEIGAIGMDECRSGESVQTGDFSANIHIDAPCSIVDTPGVIPSPERFAIG